MEYRAPSADGGTGQPQARKSWFFVAEGTIAVLQGLRHRVPAVTVVDQRRAAAGAAAAIVADPAAGRWLHHNGTVYAAPPASPHVLAASTRQAAERWPAAQRRKRRRSLPRSFQLLDWWRQRPSHKRQKGPEDTESADTPARQHSLLDVELRHGDAGSGAAGPIVYAVLARGGPTTAWLADFWSRAAVDAPGDGRVSSVSYVPPEQSAAPSHVVWPETTLMAVWWAQEAEALWRHRRGAGGSGGAVALRVAASAPSVAVIDMRPAGAANGAARVLRVSVATTATAGAGAVVFSFAAARPGSAPPFALHGAGGAAVRCGAATMVVAVALHVSVRDFGRTASASCSMN